jgi:hypothetical protein
MERSRRPLLPAGILLLRVRHLSVRTAGYVTALGTVNALDAQSY